MSARMQDSTQMRAADWIAKRAIYLDTETTGLGSDAEIVEIAILDDSGTPLLDTLIKPTQPIPPQATRVHGITDRDVANAPSFVGLYERIAFLITVRPCAIYNAAYDLRLIEQSARRRCLWPRRLEAHCTMLLYAEHYGEWDDTRNSFRWQQLANAARQSGLDIPMNLHRARADTESPRQSITGEIPFRSMMCWCPRSAPVLRRKPSAMFRKPASVMLR